MLLKDKSCSRRSSCLADLDAIRAAGRETSTVVVFTNGDAIKSVKLEKQVLLQAKTAVAKSIV